MKIIDVPQSGKCGLTVSYPGRYGLTRRSWTVPANPNTALQQVVRGNLTATASGFRALSEAQQDAWNSAAASIQTRARLGQSGPLTGLQLYVKVNTTLRQQGAPTVIVPPARPAFDPVAATALVVTNAAGVITIKLTCADDPGANTQLRAAKPMGSGVRRVPPMLILGACPVPAQGSADITALYTARFGAPKAGDRLFVSAGRVQDGWLGPVVPFTALVPAAA